MQAAAPKEGEGELFIASHQKLAVGICQTKYRNFRFGKPELPVFQKLAVVPPTVTFIQNRNFRLPKPELPETKVSQRTLLLNRHSALRLT
jgi:hypothetical protein